MQQIILSGKVLNSANPPSGCHFHPRCRYAEEIYREQAPALTAVASDHYAACHFAGNLALNGVVY